MKKQIYWISLFLLIFTFQIAAQTGSKVFYGNIADKRVQITLTREGKNLSGTYFYEKIGKDLELKGTIDAQGNFKLEERAAGKTKTGELQGKWTESENGRALLEGEWINPRNGKKLMFFADEQMIDFAGGEKLITKNINETNSAKRFEISAGYPQIAGVDASAAGKFNELAKRHVTEQVDEFRKAMMEVTAEDLKYLPKGVNYSLDIRYDVMLANDRIISVNFGRSEYTGGAHPNHYSSTLNFDLKSGQEVKLEDLFKSGSNYLKAISDYSIKDLKKRASDMTDDEWLAEGAGPKADNFSSWNLTKKGVLITFDPYQVAAYAAGPQEVLIPYSVIKEMLSDKSVISGIL